MIELKQAQSLWILAPVYPDPLNPTVPRNYGTTYSSSSAGTPLNNDALSSVSFSIKFLNQTTIGSTTYNSGDMATTFFTSVAANGFCVLATDLISPAVSVAEGLHGSVAGIDYEVTVTEKKVVSGTYQESLIKWDTVRVFGPPV